MATERQFILSAVVVAALLAGLHVSTPARASTSTEAEFRCPIDGTVFSEAVATVPMCPQDHFVLYKSRFSRAEITEISGFVESPAYRDAVAAGSRYLLAAKILEHMGRPPLDIGAMSLRASWELENRPPNKSYLRAALASFELVFAQPGLVNKTRRDLQLVCVQIERLLGDFDAATQRLEAIKRDHPALWRSRGDIIGLREKIILGWDDVEPEWLSSFVSLVRLADFAARPWSNPSCRPLLVGPKPRHPSEFLDLHARCREEGHEWDWCNACLTFMGEPYD